jgi:hypothetical protein
MICYFAFTALLSSKLDRRATALEILKILTGYGSSAGKAKGSRRG